MADLEILDWFPFYWQRFLIGTSSMKAHEIGGYVLLLSHEWKKGFLPINRGELCKISRLNSKKIEPVLEKFFEKDGKLYNEFLESVRSEQEEKHATHSKRGKKGADARWHKHGTSMAQASVSNGIREEEKRGDKKRGEENTALTKISTAKKADEHIADIRQSSDQKFKLLRILRGKIAGAMEPDMFKHLDAFAGKFDVKYPEGETLQKFGLEWGWYVTDLKIGKFDQQPAKNDGKPRQTFTLD